MADSGVVSIFLSYTRDDRAVAEAVIAALEQRGFSIWWDGRLEGGDAFARTTETELETADAVLVLWSARSITSHWVRDEATRGRDRGCMVPVSIDGSEPPLGFRQIQYLNMSNWKGKPDASEVDALERAIRLTVAAPGSQRPAQVSRPVVAASRRKMLIGAGGAAAAIGTGLIAWRTGLIGGRGAPDNSVAVLPFKNMSGDPEQVYFSDGLSEEVRSALSRDINLRVLAPTSVAAIRDLAGDMVAAARKLGVHFLLGGSVRRSGDTLRIAAELIDGKTGFGIWNERFDRTMTDVFAVQADIAQSVAGAVSAQTTRSASRDKSAGPGGTKSIRAYDAYLRGRAYYELRTGEAAYRAALGQYDAAIAIDPNYAAAHAARARVLMVIASAYAKPGELRAMQEDAIASAKLAVAKAPKLAIAQSTLGYTLVQGNLAFAAAQAPYEQSNVLGFGDSTVQLLYGVYCAQRGKEQAAQTAIDRAIALDPLNAAAFRAQALVHYLGRRFPDAVAACQRSLGLNSDIDSVHGFMGDALFHQGKFAEARAAYLEEPDASPRLAGLAMTERRLGAAAKAEAALAELIATYGDSASYQQAQIAAQAGDIRAATEKLKRARAIGDSGLGQVRGDAFFDPLRGEPAFLTLIQELGLA